MAKYQKYPEYKDSGVEWLGDVPESWKVKVLKRDLSLLTEKTDRRTYPVALENIEGWTGRFIRTNTEFQGEGVAFNKGDILFGKLRPYLAKALLAELEGEAVGDFHVMRPEKNIYGAFIQYQILTPSFIDLVNGSTFGAKMPRASWDFVSNMYITFPPLPEQIQIAKFLDHETGKIDRLIEKQQELIALLKEKRQTVISHAVTKGLNPNAPLKPSGIEWLGNIPEHWEVKRLKHLVTEPLMYGANEAAIDIDPKQPRFVRITDVSEIGTLKKNTFRSLNIELAQPYLLTTGDVLLARSGGTVGKSFIYSKNWGECCFAGYLIKASMNESRVLAKWFYLYTKTLYYWEWIGSSQIQSTIQNVSADKYNGFVLALPPISEQIKILKYLDEYTFLADNLIIKAINAISLMQERRTALISAAVTGKIDVRDWEAPLTNDE